jgi:NAD(P)-dependent dehydrogenase (short-subunit alcohol dehydrogenase family)
MSRVLVIGATRGLGASLIKAYASRPNTLSYGTTRSGQPPDGFPSSIKWLTGIDLMKEDACDRVVGQLGSGADAALSAVVR